MRGKRTKEAERGYGSSEGGEGESSDRMRAMTKVTETKRPYLKLETCQVFRLTRNLITIERVLKSRMLCTT